MSSVASSRPMPSRPKLSLFCWSRFFILAGLLSLGYVAYTMIDTELYQRSAAKQFEDALNAPKTNVPKMNVPATKMPDIVKSGTPLGRIEISSLGVGAMILEGDDDKTLRHGVGHIPGTAALGQVGNVGLAGHRDTFFRALRNIHKDDEITLETLDGPHRYIVDRIQIVLPGDIATLDQTKDSILTLVTCYPFSYVGSAPQRFVVRAHKVS